MNEPIELPYPPSINHYWRRVGNKTLISREGREYRRRVTRLLRGVKAPDGRLDVWIWVYPPDKRRRDLDNVLKALLDGLQHGGAIRDDGDIDGLFVKREDVVKSGRVLVRIEAI